jgi:hypothetical protein
MTGGFFLGVIACQYHRHDVLYISEFVPMPNGHPDFDVKERKELDRFFSALAPALEGFAQRHNLRLQKYYHQAPSWDFLFRHPSGGVGQIEVQRASEATISIVSDWWYDDYDAATRFIKSTTLGPMPVNSEVTIKLENALSEVLSWRFGDWDEQHTRGTVWRETWTKEQFEKLPAEYPEPLP